ncbi:uncharacterized peptidase C1-like protein F26E4.3 [Aphidius gifuensis]|uniref:uncharacterized peptidase C1-like protein F26E4.3 n=1 Tax=Aphidius gifuensis TaxID=684658 RepID=UPI001CDC4C12|nr:uncharacterized peptidase C1-like protein F26E4.3 [Aphidius gifuensis]
MRENIDEIFSVICATVNLSSPILSDDKFMEHSSHNMSMKYYSGRLTIFGLFLIVTTIQGEPQFDANLSCQKFSKNGVCCLEIDNNCFVYDSSNRRCYCDGACANPFQLNETDCCSDYEAYCKTPVTQLTFQTESPKNDKVDAGIKKTPTKKIGIPEDDEDAGSENSEENGSGDGDDTNPIYVTESTSEDYSSGNGDVTKPIIVTESTTTSEINSQNYDQTRKLHESSTNLPDEYVIPAEYLLPISGKWTGESWAVTASEILSNRLSMKYKLDKPIAMSTQQIISCSKTKQPDQFQKQPQDAWTFILKNNIVNESCYPLTGDNNKCQINFETNNLTQCQNSNVYEPTKLYKAREIYRVINASDVMNNEANIMTEIWKYGSVQATMEVYADFINYKAGIYKPSPDALFVGYSSIRIIGWGEESNGKFWIAANSWGTEWGENGYFKIAKGLQTCAIEYYVVGVEV